MDIKGGEFRFITFYVLLNCCNVFLILDVYCTWMKSKFKFPAYLLVLCGGVFSVLLILTLSGDTLNPTMPFGIFIIFCLFFTFVWIWLIFGELRTKVICISIENNSLTIKRYLGLGISKTYNLDDISGFKTSILSSQGGSYEYLYLMVGNRKIAKLSAFYHSNYKELKGYIAAMNIKNIGFESFSNLQEFKDIFSY